MKWNSFFFAIICLLIHESKSSDTPRLIFDASQLIPNTDKLQVIIILTSIAI